MRQPESTSIDLFWLPLSAGGHLVRLNGRVFEALSALRQRRPRCDLYHTALEIRVRDERFTVDLGHAAPARGGADAPDHTPREQAPRAPGRLADLLHPLWGENTAKALQLIAVTDGLSSSRGSQRPANGAYAVHNGFDHELLGSDHPLDDVLACAGRFADRCHQATPRIRVGPDDGPPTPGRGHQCLPAGSACHLPRRLRWLLPFARGRRDKIMRR